MTSATKVTKKSALSRQAGMTPDLDADQPFVLEGTINDRDNNFNQDPDREFDEEDAGEEQRANDAKDPGDTLYRDPATG